MCTFLCLDFHRGHQTAFSLLTPHWLGLLLFFFLDFLLLVSQEFHCQAFVHTKLFQVTWYLLYMYLCCKYMFKNKGQGLGRWLSLESAFLSNMWAWVWSPEPMWEKQGTVKDTYNPCWGSRDRQSLWCFTDQSAYVLNCRPMRDPVAKNIREWCRRNNTWNWSPASIHKGVCTYKHIHTYVHSCICVPKHMWLVKSI